MNEIYRSGEVNVFDEDTTFYCVSCERYFDYGIRLETPLVGEICDGCLTTIAIKIATARKRGR